MPPNENGKYAFSADGIQNYFNDAIKKFNDQNVRSEGADNDDMSFYEVNDLFGNKDYHEVLKNIPDQSVNKLWRNRLRHICTALQTTVVKFSGRNTSDIELGIFGSESPASDVDIGVSYKQNTTINDDVIKLSEVVEHFETFFVEKGYTSLDIDVEMYADYFISPKTGAPFIQMNSEIYTASLPYLLAGMLKNSIQAAYDISGDSCDIRRQIPNIKNRYSSEICNGLNTEDKFITLLGNSYEHLQNNISNVITKLGLDESSNAKLTEIIDKAFKAYPVNAIYTETPMERNLRSGNHPVPILNNYMSKNYNDSCREYYKLLDIAHGFYRNAITDTDEDTDEDKKNLLELNKAISHALVYRAESYMCAPTIYHVVYSMQAKPTPETLTVLQNLITVDGYKTSILEQLGYLSRFFRNYCVNTDGECVSEKWIKKKTKYVLRLENAVDKIQSEETPILQGGKKTARRKRVTKKANRRKSKTGIIMSDKRKNRIFKKISTRRKFQTKNKYNRVKQKTKKKV